MNDDLEYEANEEKNYLKNKYNLSDIYCMTDEFSNFCNKLADGDYTLLDDGDD